MEKRMSIKELRLKLRLTQAQFASELGVTPNTVSCWELEKKSPSIVNCKRIEDKYKVKLAYLYA